MTKLAQKPSHENVVGASQAIVKSLLRPESYPDRPASVECVETHISWVFLTPQFAYKLKKPVRFEFLDFSAVELREQACRDEVRLNRRLAPHVYLDVIPISTERGRLHLGGRGPAIDWVVKMRRLPGNCSLDRLIAARLVTAQEVDRVARKLANFYQQLPPVSMRTDLYREEIARHMLGNEQELLSPVHGLEVSVIERIHEAQRRFLTLWPELLDNRVLDGRIVEGHGDLRPEHVYLLPEPVIIDCIEFNEEFRTLDVADELSFLAMECTKLDAGWIGEQISDRYCEQSNDRPDSKLTYFYKTYRACVRAKVAALRAEQLSDDARCPIMDEAKCYLKLADRFAQTIGSPLLFVVRGRSGTGKSTLAAAIAQRLGISLLQTDAIRRELLGKSQAPQRYGDANYTAERRAEVYREMLRRADRLLIQGRSAVLDGTFLSAQLRIQALDVASTHNAAPLFVNCQCPEDIAKRRIAARGKLGASLSEARTNTLDYQAREDEPDPVELPTLHIDTTESLPSLVETVMATLKASITSSR